MWTGFVADNRKFIADTNAFIGKTKDQMLRVAKQSIQDTVRIAQTPGAQGGDMPVKDGFLRNSLVTQLRGATVATGGDNYVLGIAGLSLGDAFQVGWTAEYAVARHYLVNANGGLFRDKAAQQWQRIVASNAAKVR